MGLSQALATSIAGLRVTQTALSITAANVSNAETPGYIRKTLVQSTSSAGGNSVSVRVDSVNRELDQYLQRQLRIETSGGAYADLRSQFYSRLQQVYGTPGSDTALETVYNNFTTALQTLSASPDDTSARSSALSAAQILAQQLNNMSSDIQGLRSDAELGLSDSVAQANNAMSQIAAINRQLAAANPSDASTATLLDQRDNYIDQLSKLMDVRVIATDNNQVNVFTNSGIQLVGNQASQLSFNAQGTVTPQAQWNPDPSKSTVGSLMLVSPSGSSYNLIANNSIRSGQIAAYIEMRDHVLPEAQSQLDSIAAAMSQALSDTNVASTPAPAGPPDGFDIDTAGVLAGNTIHLTYTDNVSGLQHNVSIVRVDDPAALPLSDTATADPNDEVIGINFSGGMASVLTQLNAALPPLQFSNPSGSILRVVDDGVPDLANVDALSATTTATSLTGGSAQLPFFTDGTGLYTGAITSIGSQSVGLAARITVNAGLLADPSKLVTYQAGVFAGDATRPNFILNQMSNASLTYSPQTGIGSVTTPFTGNLPSFLRQVVSVQGDAADNASKLAAGQDVVVSALQQRFSDGSGVNIDEEMANLLSLQTAYAANARVMSAVKDMLDTLMKM